MGDRISRLQELSGNNKRQISVLMDASREFDTQLHALIADKNRLSNITTYDVVQGLPESLQPYARPIKGQARTMSLHSAAMVSDVMKTFDRPVERRAILQRLLERFPREHLAVVWRGDVDSSLSVAIRRAASRGLIARVGKNLYTAPTQGGSVKP